MSGASTESSSSSDVFADVVVVVPARGIPLEVIQLAPARDDEEAPRGAKLAALTHPVGQVQRSDESPREKETKEDDATKGSAEDDDYEDALGATIRAARGRLRRGTWLLSRVAGEDVEALPFGDVLKLARGDAEDGATTQPLEFVFRRANDDHPSDDGRKGGVKIYDGDAPWAAACAEEEEGIESGVADDQDDDDEEDSAAAKRGQGDGTAAENAGGRKQQQQQQQHAASALAGALRRWATLPTTSSQTTTPTTPTQTTTQASSNETTTSSSHPPTPKAHNGTATTLTATNGLAVLAAEAPFFLSPPEPRPVIITDGGKAADLAAFSALRAAHRTLKTSQLWAERRCRELSRENADLRRRLSKATDEAAKAKQQVIAAKRLPGETRNAGDKHLKSDSERAASAEEACRKLRAENLDYQNLLKIYVLEQKRDADVCLDADCAHPRSSFSIGVAPGASGAAAVKMMHSQREIDLERLCNKLMQGNADRDEEIAALRAALGASAETRDALATYHRDFFAAKKSNDRDDNKVKGPAAAAAGTSSAKK